MKKNAFILVLFIISYSVIAQTGSGTFTFQTSNGHTANINATATSLLNGAITYSISGNLNTLIPFSDYNLSAVLGVTDESLMNNLQVFGNPANQLQALLKVKEPNSIFVKVFDVHGREVATPSLLNKGNGTVEITDSFTHLANGMYVVHVLFDGKQGSFKFLKNNTLPNTAPKPQPKDAGTKTINFDISWNNVPGYLDGSEEIEIVEGSSNAFILNVEIDPAQTGDIAISPIHEGSPITNTKVTLAYEDIEYVSSETGYQHIFYNVLVPDSSNPTPYQLTIEDQLADGRFITTTASLDVYQDENGEVNGNQNIPVTDIPNEVDVSVTVRNVETEALESNTLVRLYNGTTLLDEQTTDGSGMVTFNDVPGGIPINTEVSEANYYTKTNKSINLVSPELESEMEKSINVMSIPYRTMSTGGHLPGSVVRDVLIDGKVNIGMLKGQGTMYVIPSPNEAAMKTEIQNMIQAAGYPAISFSSSQVNIPSDSEAANFNAYTSPINFGVNMTSLGGTATTTINSGTQVVAMA